MNILCLYESTFTAEPGEVKVIKAIPKVRSVTVVKPQVKCNHYLSWIPLLVMGYKVCSKQPIDFIQAESPHISGIAAVLLAKWFHKKAIIEYRCNYLGIIKARYPKRIQWFFRGLFTALQHVVIDQTTILIANCQSMAMVINKQSGLKPIGWYNPGVIAPPNARMGRSRLDAIGFLGRLEPDKGPDDFLRIIHHLYPYLKKHGLSVYLGGDGTLQENIKTYIKKHDLSALVQVMGYVDKWSFMNHIDLLVNCTKVAAPLEMVIAEAAFLGIPTVAYGTPGIPETVISGYTGYCVPIGDEAAMAAAICRLHQNPSLFANYSTNSRVYAQKYHVLKQVKNLQSIYQNI